MKITRIFCYILVLMLVLSGMSVGVCAEAEETAVTEPLSEPEETTEESPAPEEPPAGPEAEVPEETEAPSEIESPEVPEETEAPEEVKVPEFTAVEYNGATLTNVSITWDESPVTFTVSDTVKRWDPETLFWVEDGENNGVVEIVEDSNVKTLTVTNFSENALTVSVNFTPDENLPEALKDAYEGLTVTGETTLPPAESEDGVTVELTVTVELNLTDVRLPLDAAGGSFGSFTVSLQKAPDPTDG